jgi:hypothetical protein
MGFAMQLICQSNDSADPHKKAENFCPGISEASYAIPPTREAGLAQ